MRKNLGLLVFMVVMITTACSWNIIPESKRPTATPTMALATSAAPVPATPTPASATGIPVQPTLITTEIPAPTETLMPAIPSNPIPTVSVLLPVITGPAGGPVDPNGPNRFIAQVGSPSSTVNFIDPAGCQWMGIAGQVFTIDSHSFNGLVVEVAGKLGKKDIHVMAMTGDQSAFGPGGYVVKIADKPISTKNSVWVQLFDGAGSPLSQRIYLDTTDSCEKNLILLNFSEILHGAGSPVYMPLFMNNR